MSLTEAQRVALLDLARRAVAQAAGTTSPAAGAEGPPAFVESAGAFVTLYVRGALRGCVGTFDEGRTLWDTVAEMAGAAATRDPRFPPVAPEELRDLHLSISVLTPLRAIADPSEVEIGRHGIEIQRGLRRGVLLPQVATEHGFDRDTFLAETCHKAGLPRDAWREADVSIRVFEAIVFGDDR